MAIPSGRNFASCYMELCKQQRLRPLPVICVSLPYSLDFTTDRIKMDDWGPILNSLSLDRSLRAISVHSRYQCRKPLDEANSEDKARAMGKAPVVLTRYLLEWLAQSVGQCVRHSDSLTHLELDGIPFPPDCIAVLCVGLSGTESLHHLSLRRCCIGENGCELICRTIADVRSVKSLNLSHCDLTSGCGGALATALSRQKLALYHDTWKQSLRYREPDLETMPGLRRLTLNDNPHLGNCAVREIIEAIRDSLWMKALDLQRCGLNDQIGADLLNLLDQNSTLAVLDVRKNVNLNDELAIEVMRRLEENNPEGKSEYKWMGLAPRDQRTASAGTFYTVNDATAAAVAAAAVAAERTLGKASRPRSAFTGLHATRTRVQTIPPRRTMTAMTVTVPPLSSKQQQQQQQQQQQKLAPSSPPVRDQQQQPSLRVLRPRVINGAVRAPTHLATPKVSLHLDLQSRVQPATVVTSCLRRTCRDDDRGDESTGQQERANESRHGERDATRTTTMTTTMTTMTTMAATTTTAMTTTTTTTTTTTYDDSSDRVTTMSPCSVGSSPSLKVDVTAAERSTVVVGGESRGDEIHDILERLTDARAERERLLDEAKRTDLLLLEERGRREVAEMKLRTAQDNVLELENALRKKENETSGYLMVSQQSLDEICHSFDRLLELLGNVTGGDGGGGDRSPSSADQPTTTSPPTTLEEGHLSRDVSSADVKRRLEHLVIGHTKSENLKKTAVELPLQTRYVGADSARKTVKSESDVRSILPIPGTHLEKRQIGEGPAANQEPRHPPRRGDQPDNDKPISPGDRARAIFTSIVSGTVVLDFS